MYLKSIFKIFIESLKFYNINYSIKNLTWQENILYTEMYTLEIV